jgi:hypothetical protein
MLENHPPCLEQLLEAEDEEALILLHPQLLQVSLRPVPVLRSKHNDSLTQLQKEKFSVLSPLSKTFRPEKFGS